VHEQALLIYYIFLVRHGAEVVADEDVAGPSERQLPAFKGAGNIFKQYRHRWTESKKVDLIICAIA